MSLRKYILRAIFVILSSSILISHSQKKNHNPELLILPHFLIAIEKLDAIRYELQRTITIPDPLIIIISPDHFGSYSSNKLDYRSDINHVCITWECLASAGAFVDSSRLEYFYNNTTLILPDHGIGAHFQFIKHYFPRATIIPVLVQTHDDDNLETLAQALSDLSTREESIIIGSVDWSHYLAESIAIQHDKETRALLTRQASERHLWKELDVDCPSCLFLVNKLSVRYNKIPKLLRRDSSAEILGATGADNTSRWAVRYQSVD